MLWSLQRLLGVLNRDQETQSFAQIACCCPAQHLPFLILNCASFLFAAVYTVRQYGAQILYQSWFSESEIYCTILFILSCDMMKWSAMTRRPSNWITISLFFSARRHSAACGHGAAHHKISRKFLLKKSEKALRWADVFDAHLAYLLELGPSSNIEKTFITKFHFENPQFSTSSSTPAQLPFLKWSYPS